jgi:RimJ/RimL family protein N-acetyltransferase
MPAPEHEDFRRIRPPLQGSLVRLLALEEDHVPRLSQMFNDLRVLQHLSSVRFPGPVAATRAWWESSRHAEDLFPFAVETLAGELVGACDLREVSISSRTASMGIWIGVPFWNLGYGTDAVRTLCRFAFREMDLQRVELHVFETNPRAVRAYEKIGFREEGRLRRAHFSDGAYADVIVMGLLAEELLEEDATAP